MNIHRITYNPAIKSCSLYFIGCNFKCMCCYWKQIYGKVNFRKLKLLNIKDVIGILEPVKPENIYILSGDPLENEEFNQLPTVLSGKFGCKIRLNTNGYIMPSMEGITHISMSIKAVTEELHEKYTGRSVRQCLENFKIAGKSGIEVSSSSVYIPGLIEKEEIEKIARFIATVDENIPYRVIGYMKVRGLPFREPDYREVEEVSHMAGKYLKNVIFSRSSGEDYTNIKDLFTNNLRKV
ncbi:MAG: radical SAM protein [Candidatus Eremiobacterota bacterium]